MSNARTFHTPGTSFRKPKALDDRSIVERQEIDKVWDPNELSTKLDYSQASLASTSSFGYDASPACQVEIDHHEESQVNPVRKDIISLLERLLMLAVASITDIHAVDTVVLEFDQITDYMIHFISRDEVAEILIDYVLKNKTDEKSELLSNCASTLLSTFESKPFWTKHLKRQLPTLCSFKNRELQVNTNHVCRILTFLVERLTDECLEILDKYECLSDLVVACGDGPVVDVMIHIMSTKSMRGSMWPLEDCMPSFVSTICDYVFNGTSLSEPAASFLIECIRELRMVDHASPFFASLTEHGDFFGSIVDTITSGDGVPTSIQVLCVELFVSVLCFSKDVKINMNSVDDNKVNVAHVLTDWISQSELQVFVPVLVRRWLNSSLDINTSRGIPRTFIAQIIKIIDEISRVCSSFDEHMTCVEWCMLARGAMPHAHDVATMYHRRLIANDNTTTLSTNNTIPADSDALCSAMKRLELNKGPTSCPTCQGTMTRATQSSAAAVHSFFRLFSYYFMKHPSPSSVYELLVMPHGNAGRSPGAARSKSPRNRRASLPSQSDYPGILPILCFAMLDNVQCCSVLHGMGLSPATDVDVKAKRRYYVDGDDAHVAAMHCLSVVYLRLSRDISLFAMSMTAEPAWRFLVKPFRRRRNSTSNNADEDVDLPTSHLIEAVSSFANSLPQPLVNVPFEPSLALYAQLHSAGVPPSPPHAPGEKISALHHSSRYIKWLEKTADITYDKVVRHSGSRRAVSSSPLAQKLAGESDGSVPPRRESPESSSSSDDDEHSGSSNSAEQCQHNNVHKNPLCDAIRAPDGVSAVIDLIGKPVNIGNGTLSHTLNTIDPRYHVGPLHMAIADGQPSLAIVLLICGADPSVSDEFGFRPLHWACMQGRSQPVLEALLRTHVDVNCAGPCGITPLHIAARRGCVAAAGALIAAGANVNSRTDIGATPLHRAAHNRHIEVVKVLLRAGGQKDLRMAGGLIPLDLARMSGETLVAKRADGGVTSSATPSSSSLSAPSSPGGAPVSLSDGRGRSGSVSSVIELMDDLLELLQI